MTSPTSRPARISAYDYAAPTESDALSALQRVFGPVRGTDTWSAACRAAGLAPGGISSGASFERAVQSLAQQPGAAATVARALEIRLRTYQRLAARAAADPTGARR